METGTIEVEPGTPATLAAEVRQSIVATTPPWQEPLGEMVGFILSAHNSTRRWVGNCARTTVCAATAATRSTRRRMLPSSRPRTPRTTSQG